MSSYKAPFKGQTEELMHLSYSITDCHHSTPLYLEKGRLVIRNYNIKNGRMILDNLSYTDDENFNQRTSRATPEAGDLIITREAPMGEVCIIPEEVECCLGQRMVLIKPDSNKVDNQFLLYAILSEFVQEQINKSNGTGSIVSNLRIPVLKELKIPHSNLEEQKKIGKVLSDIDSKIELNNKINDELESMAKLIYDYWFVQFDFPDENGMPYKSSGGKMRYSEELNREIPELWKVHKLTDLIDWTSGAQPPKSTFIHEEKEGYIRFIQNRDYAGYKSRSYIPIAKQNKTCDELDIMMDKYGDAGKVRFGLAGAYNVALSKIEVLDPYGQEFFRQYFSCSWIHDYLKKACIASTRASLSKENLQFLFVALPPKSLLIKFEKTNKKNLKYILNNRKQNEKLSELRDWLLLMLMNGQVTVK